MDDADASGPAGSGTPDGGTADGGEFDHLDGDDLLEELSELEEIVDSPAEREQVRETMEVARALTRRGRVRRVVSGFDAGDAAESLLGALLFGIPMAVEGGTSEVAVFLARRPPLLLGNLAAALVVVSALIYVSDVRNVRIRDPLFGIVPRRLTGVVLISALTAAALFTGWGRVSWTDPVLAAATVAVAFVPMSIGAALGDLLPEE